MRILTSVLTFLGFLGIMGISAYVESCVTSRTWNKIIFSVHFPMAIISGVVLAASPYNSVIKTLGAVAIGVLIVGYLWVLARNRRITGSIFGTYIPTQPESRAVLTLRNAVGYYQTEVENPVQDLTMIRLRRTQMFEALNEVNTLREKQ